MAVPVAQTTYDQVVASRNGHQAQLDQLNQQVQQAQQQVAFNQQMIDDYNQIIAELEVSNG